jgi:hypothetical protein
VLVDRSLENLFQCLDSLLSDERYDYWDQVLMYVGETISETDCKEPFRNWLTRLIKVTVSREKRHKILRFCLVHIPDTPIVFEDLFWLLELTTDSDTRWAACGAYMESNKPSEKFIKHYAIYSHTLESLGVAASRLSDEDLMYLFSSARE